MPDISGDMLKLSDFNYELPPELIAHQPMEPRDHSRLMVINRQSSEISHKYFYELVDLLGPNDVLVRNNTKVIPARIFGQKSTGGFVEVLLVKPEKTNDQGEVWECLSKPGLKLGQVLRFSDSNLTAICIEVRDFTRLVQFNQKHIELLISLDKIGQTPLPPYIKWQPTDELTMRQRYQTTYAQYQGSVAAPTAGLHFTPELDAQLHAKGVQIEEVTLHVGLGTFLPVKIDDVTQHPMHSEWYELTAKTAAQLNTAKTAGKHIIAVGTTTCRVLETCSDESEKLTAAQGETAIFIYPPYKFKCVDSLISNFHLPESTLLMLVSSLVSKPNTNTEFTNFERSIIGFSYQEAIQNNYRFYSFGDGMLIV